MKIRHERPMSDLAFQVRAPLGLELATGETVTISYWSLDGFEFPGNSDVLPKEATLSIPFQGVDIRFPVTLERQGDTRKLSFRGLTGRQRETLSVFYRSILSGKMASTEDVITSLDTPVDLVPMEETEEEKAVATAGKTPRSLRAVCTVLLYICLASLIAWTLGAGIYAKVSTIDVLNARVEAPLTSYASGQGGYAYRVEVAVGDRVAAGDRLVRMVDTDGEAEIADVRARITFLEGRIEELEDRNARLAARIEDERLRLVYVLLTAPTREIETRQRALDDFDARMSPAHFDLFEAKDSVARELELLTDELRRLRRERGRLSTALDALHIVATESGIVREVPIREEQYLDRGEVAVVIEGETARIIRGWLDQSHAGRVFPGMRATASYNTGLGAFDTEGRVTAVEAGVDETLSPEFGLLVEVTLPALTAEDSRSALPNLMPVELDVQRGWAGRLAARVAAILRQEG